MIAARTSNLLSRLCRPLVSNWRYLSCSPALRGKQMPQRPSVDEDEIVETFLKGSGPGGQKSKFRPSDSFSIVSANPSPVNKTASAVQLRHLPTGLVVKSQATRSREQNRKIARNILALKLEERFKGDESRAAKLREEATRKKASKTKKAKRKYAKLDAEKAAAADDGTDEDTEDLLGTRPESGNDIAEATDGTCEATDGNTVERKEQPRSPHIKIKD